MISSLETKKVQIALAQYLAAAVYRMQSFSIPLEIGSFPFGCFYDFAMPKPVEQLMSSIDEIAHQMILNETALRREMVAKNAASLFRAEKKPHLAKKAEALGSRLIYVFQLQSFFFLSTEDLSLDFSSLHFMVKECISRGTFSKKELPVIRIVAYTAFSQKNLQLLLRDRRLLRTKMHHILGKEMDLFYFHYSQNMERMVWTERGTSIFFRLQQFWHRFLHINDIVLANPYPIREEIQSYYNQIQKLPTCFAQMYSDYHGGSECSSPFSNLYSLSLEMKDCNYEFCSHRSLQKRLDRTHKLIESFYDFLHLPYFTKRTRKSTRYFYNSILGKPIHLGYTSISQLDKNISIIEYSVTHSLERLIGVLLEHFEGNLPFWLNPAQIYITCEPSQLPKIKKILLNRYITYHLQPMGKKTKETILLRAKELKAFYRLIVFKNGEIRIMGDKNEEQMLTFSELDTLLGELEKKNCPEKLIIE